MSGRNHGGQDHFKSISNNFRPYFINDVTQAYGSKFGHSGGLVNFGDKDNEGEINRRIQVLSIEEIEDTGRNIGSNDMPENIVKHNRETIGAGGFKR